MVGCGDRPDAPSIADLLRDLLSREYTECGDGHHHDLPARGGLQRLQQPDDAGHRHRVEHLREIRHDATRRPDDRRATWALRSIQVRRRLRAQEHREGPRQHATVRGPPPPALGLHHRRHGDGGERRRTCCGLGPPTAGTRGHRRIRPPARGLGVSLASWRRASVTRLECPNLRVRTEKSLASSHFRPLSHPCRRRRRSARSGARRRQRARPRYLAATRLPAHLCHETPHKRAAIGRTGTWSWRYPRSGQRASRGRRRRKCGLGTAGVPVAFARVSPLIFGVLTIQSAAGSQNGYTDTSPRTSARGM